LTLKKFEQKCLSRAARHAQFALPGVPSFKKGGQTMLMWTASLFASLFHCNAPADLKLVQLDKPVSAQAVPADQNILKTIVDTLTRIDGFPYP
jgi:hypothetical protein